MDLAKPSIGSRVAAWLSAWQWVLYLAAALLVSVGLNVWQWNRAITAPYRAENKDLRAAVGVYERLTRERTTDDAELMAELRGIADRARPVRVEYLKAAAERPLAPNCAPGKARMDAVNAGADP